MATVAREAGAQDVRTTLMYAGAIAGRPRLDFPDPANSNIALDPHEVTIRDGRPFAGVHTLERNGFAFTRHRSSVAEDPVLFDQADNADQVTQDGLLAAYAEEMVAFLGDRIGAATIVPQVGSFIARTSRRARKPTWAGTAEMVHLDYTPEAAALFLGWNAQTSGRPLPPHRAYAFIQTWRALSPGPQDNSLAICDGASVPPSDGVEIDTVMGPADVPGKCFPFRICKYRPDHQWFYLPDMAPDDLILFKGFDSREPQSMNAMHSAFDNPLAGPDAAPRRSIEARFIAFFD